MLQNLNKWMGFFTFLSIMNSGINSTKVLVKSVYLKIFCVIILTIVELVLSKGN